MIAPIRTYLQARRRAQQKAQEMQEFLDSATAREELDRAARQAAREVVYRHRLDNVSTEVLLQPINRQVELTFGGGSRG